MGDKEDFEPRSGALSVGTIAPKESEPHSGDLCKKFIYLCLKCLILTFKVRFNCLAFLFVL
jgi:hypothetical protein